MEHQVFKINPPGGAFWSERDIIWEDPEHPGMECILDLPTPEGTNGPATYMNMCYSDGWVYAGNHLEETFPIYPNQVTVSSPEVYGYGGTRCWVGGGTATYPAFLDRMNIVSSDLPGVPSDIVLPGPPFLNSQPSGYLGPNVHVTGNSYLSGAYIAAAASWHNSDNMIGNLPGRSMIAYMLFDLSPPNDYSYGSCVMYKIGNVLNSVIIGMHATAKGLDVSGSQLRGLGTSGYALIDMDDDKSGTISNSCVRMEGKLDIEELKIKSCSDLYLQPGQSYYSKIYMDKLILLNFKGRLDLLRLYEDVIEETPGQMKPSYTFVNTEFNGTMTFYPARGFNGLRFSMINTSLKKIDTNGHDFLVRINGHLDEQTQPIEVILYNCTWEPVDTCIGIQLDASLLEDTFLSCDGVKRIILSEVHFDRNDTEQVWSSSACSSGTGWLWYYDVQPIDKAKKDLAQYRIPTNKLDACELALPVYGPTPLKEKIERKVDYGKLFSGPINSANPLKNEAEKLRLFDVLEDFVPTGSTCSTVKTIQ